MKGLTFTIDKYLDTLRNKINVTSPNNSWNINIGGYSYHSFQYNPFHLV